LHPASTEQNTTEPSFSLVNDVHTAGTIYVELHVLK
jgi:hypothetical protein